ncbi:twin-arginine translocase subunit TatC [Rubritalea marina]|uniref:twin-arginine translocase subunit TatC n=1 Tax=Rubritalea marina TaxID=361055 RepID=UPI00036EED0E|nr:twin-arginine translocase subunit TatC [Rubritalea marina]
MFLLNKAFQLRDKANKNEDEKPFLEHLEDLRITITRIVVVLLISTLACFTLKDKLMDLLRKPIVTVWEQSQAATLPTSLTPEIWELAKRSAHHAETLNPEERAVYFSQFEEEKLAFYASCTNYYRAALTLKDKDARLKFIQELPKLSDEQRTLLTTMLDKGKDEALANAKVDAKNNVVYMRSLKPTETFMLSLKLAFFAGIVVAFPLVLYFTLQFVLPGLKNEEKKALWPAMFVGFGLFLSGVFFCYYLVLPKALEFFYVYSNSMGVENEWRIGEYITFATQFTLIFGLAFELPVVVMTLVKLGLLDYDLMSRTRSYAIVSIFVIAAIITPTGDALTLSMLAVPMALLYECCIWFAYFTRNKELKEEEEEAFATASAPIQEYGMSEEEQLEQYRREHAHLYENTEEDTDESKHYDKEYFDKEAEQQTDGEGEELDDGESEEDPLKFLDQIRQPYDPSLHGGVDEQGEDESDEDESANASSESEQASDIENEDHPKAQKNEQNETEDDTK